MANEQYELHCRGAAADDDDDQSECRTTQDGVEVGKARTVFPKTIFNFQECVL